MSDALIRTESLIGTDKLEVLKSAHVAVFGIGGVGGYAVEALARSGVGKLTLVDADVISCSNLNRQILATVSSVGQPKVDLAEQRIASVNPECIVDKFQLFFNEETANEIDFGAFDYVIDAIDVVSSKILLITKCKEKDVPIVSCMGTGNRMVADFVITDVEKSKGCPLARVMRKELKDRGIKGVDVLYSQSAPYSSAVTAEHGRHAPASICHVPAIAGMTLAGHVIGKLIK